MAEPDWIAKEALLVLHTKSIAAHGGIDGLRDEGLLESALQRPLNRFHYEGEQDIAALAATYGVAVAKNHPFLDGNKRAAFLCLTLFLHLNGRRLTADQVDATRTMYAVGASEIGLDGLAEWIRANSRPA